MTTQEFVNNMKLNSNWDENDFESWVQQNQPMGDTLSQRIAYLESKGADWTQDDVDEFVEEHGGDNSPTDPPMQVIPYQFYLLWQTFINNCDYC